MRKLIPLLAALLVFALAGCSKVPMLPGLSAYRIEIQQGNYVTQDMVAKLKPGMSKSQVRFALGTPLVVDPFHNDRWDYVYTLNKRGRLVEHRRIIVHFADDKLVRIDGDVASAAVETTEAAATSVPAAISAPTATSAPAATPTPVPLHSAAVAAPAPAPAPENPPK